MIETPAGLKQTIEQLNRQHRVLEELRKRMGTNPAQFQLFAEGPLDEIRKLRREIDEYLGIEPLELALDDEQRIVSAGQ
jgi:hypothetical protein